MYKFGTRFAQLSPKYGAHPEHSMLLLKGIFFYKSLYPGALSNHLSIDNWEGKKGSIFVIFLVVLIYCSHPRDRLLYGISIPWVVKNVKVRENESSRSFMK